MGTYIVTDLTRFRSSEKVCTAVIDLDSGACLRPMPYFASSKVKELNMHPGAILEGEISLKSDAVNPHVEDASYRGLRYREPASSEEFKESLKGSLSSSISSGFGTPFSSRQKHIPYGSKTKCSIITIKVEPSALSIHEDKYSPGKIKCSFTDGNGDDYSYLAITDRGFFDYAKKHQSDGQLSKLQAFLAKQEEIYLRIGLSRRHNPPGDSRDGYWLQVNGIYTFPDFLEEIRSYV